MFCRRPPTLALLLICSAIDSLAGGPAFVAGSGYDPGVKGQALTWSNGSIEYSTDQGDLSPILTAAQADFCCKCLQHLD